MSRMTSWSKQQQLPKNLDKTFLGARGPDPHSERIVIYVFHNVMRTQPSWTICARVDVKDVQVPHAQRNGHNVNPVCEGVTSTVKRAFRHAPYSWLPDVLEAFFSETWRTTCRSYLDVVHHFFRLVMIRFGQLGRLL